MKGMKLLKGTLAAVLAATFIVSGIPATSIKADASVTTYSSNGVKVEYYEVAQSLTKKGSIAYKDTGNNYVTITPGLYAKNVLEVKISDSDAKIRNVSCKRDLRYKKTSKIVDEKEDTVTYRFSFYTTKEKRYTFKFSVRGSNYEVKDCQIKINSASPVKKATFGNSVLSTKAGMLGSLNYVTDAKKGKLKVEMNKGYTLNSIMVGKYRNEKDASGNNQPVLYWTQHKNGKKVTLSEEMQVTDYEDSNTTVTESSMYATTVIRVNYTYKDGKTGSIDYYLNKIVDTDND
jgi:hypothetical protein